MVTPFAGMASWRYFVVAGMVVQAIPKAAINVYLDPFSDRGVDRALLGSEAAQGRRRSRRARECIERRLISCVRRFSF